MASPSQHRVTATVTIDTTPEASFDAWLDPRQAVRFLAANTTTVAEFANDPREGGVFRLVMQGVGTRFEHTGRYVVIDRPHPAGLHLDIRRNRLPPVACDRRLHSGRQQIGRAHV